MPVNRRYYTTECTLVRVINGPFASSCSGAMDIALGQAATGVFTNSMSLWQRIFQVCVPGTVHQMN